MSETIAVGWTSQRVFIYLSSIVLIFALFTTYYYELDPAEIINPKENMATEESIYSFSYLNIKGENVPMENYKGHVTIVFNTASKCGFTKQLEQLQALYDKYKDSEGLRIVGFPCNQFGSQEPASENEIQEFCSRTYNVSFDLSKKIKVNGEGTHPIWEFLKARQGGTLGSFIKWNFTKFVIDKQGNVVHRYAPTTDPMSMEKELVELFKK